MCRTDIVACSLSYISLLSKRIRAERANGKPTVTLIGFFPIHGGKKCDTIVSVKNYNGFQRMEAFVLALKTLNEKRDSEVLMEAILYDSCSDSLAEHVILSQNIPKYFKIFSAHPSSGPRHQHDRRGEQENPSKEEHHHRGGWGLLQQRHHSILKSNSGPEASFDIVRCH